MDAKTDDKSAGKCPFTGTRGHTNRDWWPDALDIEMLHRNSALVRSDGQGRSTTPRSSRRSTSTP